MEDDEGGGVTIRAFHPDAQSIEVCLEKGQAIPMKLIHPGGVFAATVRGRRWPFFYRLRFHFASGNPWEIIDPYRFLPTLGEMDLYLFGEGSHQRIYDTLGAHMREVDGISGISFAVWAPNATGVSIVGERAMTGRAMTVSVTPIVCGLLLAFVSAIVIVAGYAPVARPLVV